ncbi:MAG: MMPL family transporter [Verrucomicrobiaceae bacterium]|nr:MMPL family transporter [Verrucomicrobiaceae bacterium]
MRRSWLPALVLLPLVAWGWSRLRLETDILATLPPDLAEVQALRQLRDGFSGGTDLVIAIEGDDADAAEAFASDAASALEARHDLVKEVQRAESITSGEGRAAGLVAWAVQNAPTVKVQALRESLEGDAARNKLATSLGRVSESLDLVASQRAAYDPFGLLEPLGESLDALEGGMFGLVSEDGAFRVLMVTPAADVTNYRAAAAWLAEVQNLLPTMQSVRVRFTGEPAFQAEIGAGIERDMSGTVGFTEVLIALLFWLMFKRLKPMIWIQGLLILTMLLTLGFGGLIVGKLSIMSLAFAAIVLGIVVDYAVLIIQEARQHPGADAASLRSQAGPGITAGALTTATVFLSLLFSGLPGMAELGLLVALGVICGHGIMLWLAPKLAAGRQQVIALHSVKPVSAQAHQVIAGSTLLLVGGAAIVFWQKGLPQFDSRAEALRPSKSEAMDALNWMQQRLGRDDEVSLPVLVRAGRQHLRQAAVQTEVAMKKAAADGIITRFVMPSQLVTDPAAQAANKVHLEWMVAETPRLESAATEAGFTPAAMGLWKAVIAAWRQSPVEDWPAEPTDSPVASTLSRFLGPEAVLGSVSCGTGSVEQAKQAISSVSAAKLAGWEVLGSALSDLVRTDLQRQMLPILAVLAVTLLITFRSGWDLLLSLIMLIAGLGALAATMSFLGWTWNLASLAAIPLLLGTGLDYGIHILLAMKRTGNDVALVQATTGRAVLFSGLTTVIGFGSLCFTSNRGIASLGLACCVGTLWILFFVIVFLPYWRAWLVGSGKQISGNPRNG